MKSAQQQTLSVGVYSMCYLRKNKSSPMRGCFVFSIDLSGTYQTIVKNAADTDCERLQKVAFILIQSWCQSRFCGSSPTTGRSNASPNSQRKLADMLAISLSPHCLGLTLTHWHRQRLQTDAYQPTRLDGRGQVIVLLMGVILHRQG